MVFLDFTKDQKSSTLLVSHFLPEKHPSVHKLK